ncbi:MAG: TIGR01777 family oxidoreductase [Solidesulfovibrio sp.]|uniref:TIGR01777 family oxidoreductase n=1 Tax=Solidesulfovibrio sp. TaxID=2910990 RepID=UPI002B1EE700|nr:TIGR01777 family oxidoreductase [Solidesulfovibrio sp.]MEA4857356.1 TIGR01777 family oxidoreductase [Solidesulfovibrio sp.]
MRVVIAGGTGFIGRALVRSLTDDGHEAVVLSRTASGHRSRPGVTFAPFDGRTATGWGHLLDGAGALVNLAGENIASGYWTRARKGRLRDSRLFAGQAVMEALSGVAAPPAVLVQGSATGYYGDRGELPTDESAPCGQGFLAGLARDWEASTAGAEALGIRRVVARTAVVLGAGGGALPRMLAPYRYFLGGPLGSGRQYFPWIHLHDEVAAIRFLLDEPRASGPFNLAAPGAVSQDELAGALGRALGRPSFLRVPEAALRLLLGEMGRELFLSGVRAVPAKLSALGFVFRHPSLGAALADLLAGAGGFRG